MEYSTRDVDDALSKCRKKYKFVSSDEHYINVAAEFEKYRDQLGWYFELYEQPQKTKLSLWYPPYSELELTLQQILESDKLIDTFEKKNSNYIVKKNTFLYKGTKYFYTPQQERELTKDIEFMYFGDKDIAYLYASRYCGGIQIYNVADDIVLFNVTNDKNIQYIISELEKHDASSTCIVDTFGNNITYGKMLYIIRVKYGIGIDKCKQLYDISKNEKYDLIWTRAPQKEYKYRDTNTYHGWYYGSGYIDRMCVGGIKKIVDNKFDGIISEPGYYSPYSALPSSSEFIIWNTNKLKRDTEHIYDSMQVAKYLKIHHNLDVSSVVFNEKFAQRNTNFTMLKFYLNHKLDNSSLVCPNYKFKIMTYNVHDLVSVNMNDSYSTIIEEILYMMLKCDIDICCLQEFYRNIPIVHKNYTTIQSQSHVGIVVLVKKTLNVKNITSFRLPIVDKDKKFDNRRFGVIFEIGNKKFCNTHLEIGYRFMTKKKSVLLPSELVDVINKNYKIRTEQLRKIFSYHPDYIIGDFNFNTRDKEYDYMIQKGWYSGKVNYTTPFNTQVDFVFSKTKYDKLDVIKCPYSDHLPIVAYFKEL